MKRFNITGTCIPEKNYIVDTSKKLDTIMQMIEDNEYFVINRPRQYGKTTTLFLLMRRLLSSGEHLPIKISFEGYGDAVFRTEEAFCPTFLNDLANDYTVKNQGYSSIFLAQKGEVKGFNDLSQALSIILSKIPKKVVLMIDEVDKSSNNELFLHFLGMLRTKYLNAKEDRDITFQSVILAGVNDIRSLKQKIRPESQSQLNSPWNIAVPFLLDMSFNPAEIETMLAEYVAETGVQMDTKAISERLHFWTSGYPFLVSYICWVVAEDIFPNSQGKVWEVSFIDEVVRRLKFESNTLFDVLIKNLASYPELEEMMENIVLGLSEYVFDSSQLLISQANMYGFISRNPKGLVQVHNKLFEQKIINYIILKNNAGKDDRYNIPNHFILENGRLNIEFVLQRFQEAVKEKHSKRFRDKDDQYLERDFRLLFLLFLTPIINGTGYSFQEVEISEERRLDVVISFLDERFVVELKLWNGPQYHEQGKQRLKQYMQAMSIDKGYMLILDKTKTKTFTNEVEDGILMVYV